MALKGLVLGLLMSGVIVAGYGAVHAQNPATTQCTIAGKGAVDVGWVEIQATQRYRCVATFDSAFKRVGTAWIRVDADGRPQVP